ncbi:SPOR domain-containing protein [Candidatus Magnetaquicoccus inordinatus]|uniref:SPOR domain-containing protein n=1 Tax=Candidatus Magnetaquicoccus inordinatus TaxID=2496818 RepID=UPI00102C6E6C|nr:SPOR domain-containing protein [Candidatus Magnetaquicoccus inordinatus]
MLIVRQNHRRFILWMALLCAVLCSVASLHASEPNKTNSDAPPRRFTLLVEPAHAKVDILNLKTPYQPEMLLKPGRYHIAVSAPNHVTERGFIDVTDQDWVGKVVLLPMSGSAKGEEQEESVAARIEEEWQKIKREKDQLAKSKQNLDRDKEKLELAWKELENGKAALETQRKELEEKRREWENAQKRLASAPSADGKISADKPLNSESKNPAEKTVTEKTLTEKTIAEQRELPVPTPAPQAIPRSKLNKEVSPIAEPPPVPVLQPLAAAVETTPARESAESASPAETPAAASTSLAASPSPQEPAGEESVTTHAQPSAQSSQPTLLSATPAPEKPPVEAAVSSSKTTEDPSLATVLNEAKRYLRLPRAPRSEPPPESDGILQKLQLAQKEHPGNQEIAQALQLHGKRYIAYIGLFEIKEKADAMVKNIESLGVPAFLQVMTVKNKPGMRVCIGPFLQQADAEKSLRFLLDKVEMKDPIMRIYKQ